MTATINAETGEYISNEGRSPRFTLWAFLMMCSVITLKSSAEVKSDQDDPTKAVKLAVGISALTLMISIIVLAAHLLPIASTLIVGTKIEGILTFLLAIFWIATVGVVNETSHKNLGTINEGEILNANLYYAAWAGFALSILLFVSYLKSAYGLDLASSANRGHRIMHWGALLAATLVVLGSSARILNKDCDGDLDGKKAYCFRTKFGVAYGTIGMVLAIAGVASKLFTSVTSVVVEFAVSVVFAVFGGFAVSFITSNKGPGAEIGNLYYSSWLAFITSILISVACFNVYKGGNNNVPEESDVPNSSENLQKPHLNLEDLDQTENDDVERGYD